MDDLKLENQLCFPLYAASKKIIQMYKPFLDEIGLTYTQYISMMVIWDKKEIGIKSLGELLHLDSGTLTPVVKRLEQHGLITRQRSQKDERNLIIRITEEGKKLKEQARSIPEKLAKCVNIDKEEAVVLYRLLYKILSNSC